MKYRLLWWNKCDMCLYFLSPSFSVSLQHCNVQKSIFVNKERYFDCQTNSIYFHNLKMTIKTSLKRPQQSGQYLLHLSKLGASWKAPGCELWKMLLSVCSGRSGLSGTWVFLCSSDMSFKSSWQITLCSRQSAQDMACSSAMCFVWDLPWAGCQFGDNISSILPYMGHTALAIVRIFYNFAVKPTNLFPHFEIGLDIHN